MAKKGDNFLNLRFVLCFVCAVVCTYLILYVGMYSLQHPFTSVLIRQERLNLKIPQKSRRTFYYLL